MGVILRRGQYIFRVSYIVYVACNIAQLILFVHLNLHAQVGLWWLAGRPATIGAHIHMSKPISEIDAMTLSNCHVFVLYIHIWMSAWYNAQEVGGWWAA